ncbi:AP-4 complex subunit sigma-1 [Strigomonas culicis]|uniref:AP complex subunit sigma n=1 Tax=Strigomonas culicis TaxID=28005 RepID=S9WM46_9TRYP|nr:AP-4 complex subunit sigma-1 [Strigomonas culicis]|eukprot:EPY37085.1 AP-4 complex subunit sigma-1 [Strigomonas culicis]
MSIEFLILVNKQGQTRFSHYKAYVSSESRISLEGVIGRKCIRRSATESSVFEYNTYTIVYRQYASLFFIVGVSTASSDLSGVSSGSVNLLSIYEFIHCVVETLNEYFEDVCEIDVLFNLEKVHFVIDEMISNGAVGETNRQHVLCAVGMTE